MADKKQTKTTTTTKAKAATASKVKKAKKTVAKGNIYIYTSYNNTLITFSDSEGRVLAWSSGGIVGFKGSRKSTPYAGQKAAEDLNNKISKFSVQEVDVYIKGPGVAKQLALRELGNGGYRINSLVDNTPIRMGGVKPRKKPRK